MQKPGLKAIARTPVLPAQQMVATATAERDTTQRRWLGATIRNIADEGEMSAFGLPGVTGVLVLDVPASSALKKFGLQNSDIIFSVNGTKTTDVAALLRQSVEQTTRCSVVVYRNQKETNLLFPP